MFLVYPTLLPSKDPETPVLHVGSKDISTGDSRTRRRLREEPEAVAEGGGEGMSTASVALKAERYRPRIYGFQVNEIAKLQRWQEAVRDRSVSFRLFGNFTNDICVGKLRDWKLWKRRMHRILLSSF